MGGFNYQDEDSTPIKNAETPVVEEQVITDDSITVDTLQSEIPE